LHDPASLVPFACEVEGYAMRSALIAFALVFLAAAPAMAQKPDDGISASSSGLTIRICNESGRNAFTAVIYQRDGVWRSEGWFRVDNGACRDIVTADHLRFYAFAEEVDNTGYSWAGNFEHCITRPGPYNDVVNPNNTTCPQESVMFSEWVADHYGTFTWTLDP
jgi:uncharacterized membrane protein